MFQAYVQSAHLKKASSNFETSKIPKSFVIIVIGIKITEANNHWFGMNLQMNLFMKTMHS